MIYLIIGLSLSFFSVFSMEFDYVRLQYLPQEIKDDNLRMAVFSKNCYMLNVCLDVGANAFAIGENGCCAIDYCTITRNDDANSVALKNEMRMIFITRLANFNQIYKDSVIRWIARNKKYYLLGFCLDIAANPFSMNEYGDCAINFCITHRTDDDGSITIKKDMREILTNRLKNLSQADKDHNLREAVSNNNYDLMIFCLDIDANPLALNDQHFCAINFAIANPDEPNRTIKEDMVTFLMGLPIVRESIPKSAIGSYLLIDALYKRNSPLCITLCSIGIDMFTSDIFERFPYSYMIELLPGVGKYLYSNNECYRARADDFAKHCAQARQSTGAQQQQKVAATCPAYSAKDVAYLKLLNINFNPKMPPTPYTILNIRNDATLSEIKQAHKELLTKWHPDKFPNKSVKERSDVENVCQLINQAYQYLSENADPGVPLALECSEKTIRDVCGSLKEIPDLRNRGITSLEGLKELYAREGNKIIICLANNKIVSLNARCFEGMSIGTLSLSNNSIKSIDPDAFLRANILTELNASNNCITSLALANVCLKNLSKLTISHNELAEIGEKTLQGMPNLTHLDASFNKIKIIDPLAFQFNNQLKKVDLSGNLLMLEKSKRSAKEALRKQCSLAGVQLTL